MNFLYKPSHPLVMIGLEVSKKTGLPIAMVAVRHDVAKTLPDAFVHENKERIVAFEPRMRPGWFYDIPASVKRRF